MKQFYTVGDKVKIIHTDNTTELFANKIGVVTKIVEQNEPNIGVRFEDDWNVFFYTVELEKVTG